MDIQEMTHQPDPRRWLMLTVVLSAALVVVLDGFIVNVAIPSIERELHAGFADLQLVVAGYTLAFAVLLVTGGRIGDLYGRKRVFLLGMAGFTLFSACCGLAPNALSLIIFRIAQGAAAALMFPQVVSFIQVSFAPEERPRAFGYYGAISGLASILGQVLGGFLLAANLFGIGWRSIFLVNVPLGVVALVAALLLLRESREAQAPHGLDYGGVTLLTLTLFLLVFPMIEGESTGWSIWLLIFLLLSVPALIVFLAYENWTTRQGKIPLVSLVLFRQRRFPAGLLTVALASALFAALLFLLAFYLQTILQLTPLQAGLVIMAASISFSLASFLSSRVNARLGKRGLSAATALVTLGYALVLLSAQWFVPLWGMPPFLVALFLLGMGMGLLNASLLPKALEDVAHHDAGVASGAYTTASQIAGALGVTLIGLLDARLLASSGNPVHAFAISVLVLALLSLGLSLSVLPLAQLRPATTEHEELSHKQELAPESQAETVPISPKEEGVCLPCQKA